jgi:cysteine synthase A
MYRYRPGNRQERRDLLRHILRLQCGCRPKSGPKISDKQLIVTMINDNGLRYLSTPLCGTQSERKELDREYSLKPEDRQKLASYNLEVIK